MLQDIWHALQDGAPFSFVNIAVLAFVLAITIERFVFIFTKYRVNSLEFMAQIRKLVQANNIDRAIKLCEAAPLPLLQVIKSGLTQAHKGEEAVIASMEERMSEVLPALEKRIGALWSLANIGTLIGLLGTISGLIRAFSAVGKINDPGEKTRILSAGIAEAMWNTALGLFIAVTAMVAHLILHGMAKRQKHEMEQATMKLENLLTVKQKS
jgi:biopolymer transport protein ExbB/TolQ